MASTIESVGTPAPGSDKAPEAARSHLDAAQRFAAFLAERGMPTAAEAIRREHIEAYIDDQLEARRPRRTRVRARREAGALA